MKNRKMATNKGINKDCLQIRQRKQKKEGKKGH